MSSGVSVAITEPGRRTVERYDQRSPKFAILQALAEHSPKSISQIGDDTDLDAYEVKQWVKELERSKMVVVQGGFE